MVLAYILIEMIAGHSRKLVTTLVNQKAFNVVDRVTGPYDVIAVVEAPDIDAVSDIVASQIHTLEGVVRTTTCIALQQ